MVPPIDKGIGLSLWDGSDLTTFQHFHSNNLNSDPHFLISCSLKSLIISLLDFIKSGPHFFHFPWSCQGTSVGKFFCPSTFSLRISFLLWCFLRILCLILLQPLFTKSILTIYCQASPGKHTSTFLQGKDSLFYIGVPNFWQITWLTRDVLLSIC